MYICQINYLLLILSYISILLFNNNLIKKIFLSFIINIKYLYT